MQCRRAERGELYQGLLRRAGKYRADELAAEGQPAAGRGADRRGRREAAGDRLSRAWLVGRASANREYRCRRSAGMDARRARSEEHTSELQSLMRTSYAVLCLQKK